MACVLYEHLGADDRRFSPHVWRSLLALHHKGLTPERRPLCFTQLDQVEFSGHKRVPVLVDGERTVTDSWDIACYLEDTYADAPSLFGGTMGRAQARFIDHWTSTRLHPGLIRHIVLDIHDHLAAADREYFRNSREARMGGPLEEVQAEARVHALESLQASLGPLRATLAAQPFLCGEKPAYADYIVFGAFQWARCISPFAVVADDDPICGWRRNMLDLFDGLGAEAVGYPV
jgi:glutathione S-transferase